MLCNWNITCACRTFKWHFLKLTPCLFLLLFLASIDPLKLFGGQVNKNILFLIDNSGFPNHTFRATGQPPCANISFTAYTVIIRRSVVCQGGGDLYIGLVHCEIGEK